MKKATKSYWGLTARSSLPWLGIICPVMTIAEVFLFRFSEWNQPDLDEAARHSSLMVFWIAAIMEMHVAYCVLGLLRADSELALGRLRVDRKCRFWVLAGQNALTFGMLWVWQTVLAVLLCVMWLAGHPESAGPHTLFTAFYRSSVLHGLLPLGDALLWVRNLVFLATLGMASAKAALSRKFVGPVILGLFIAVFWPIGTNMAVPELLEIAACAIASFLMRDGGVREPLE